jgi:transposase
MTLGGNQNNPPIVNSVAEGKNLTDRQIRGLQIAKTSRIRKSSSGWVVPSQSGSGSYVVKLDRHEPSCTCPDCEMRRAKCKHIWAVEYYVRQTMDSEGNTTTTKAMKVTYTQDWSAYDKAQTQQKSIFLKLLRDLCDTIPQPAYTFGRPKMPMSDMVFASALKVFTTFSLRRFTSDMRTAKELGFIDKTPHYSTVARYMESEDLTPIIERLIQISSLPLVAVEKDFAVDSSGFSGSRFARFFSYKHGRDVKYKEWIKAHVISGTRTNIITGIEITEGKRSDSPYFKPLVEKTAENFEIKEVSADKAYSSRANTEIVNSYGGVAYIPFRCNATGKARGSKLWRKMWHYFEFNREEFLQHYHKRSNSETVFHMIKTKFGDSVRSKSRTAQINEVLLKALCHNICVVIQEMFELGIDGRFA